jgi:serine phosphatase RsbU (regulator of sigma subunit)
VENTLFTIAKKFRPELDASGATDRLGGVADVLGVLYSAPLTLLGLLWLVAVTDLSLMKDEWLTLLILLVLVFLFDHFHFFIHLDVEGLFLSAEGSLRRIATWSGALLFGPSALWLAVLATLGRFFHEWRDAASVGTRWGLARKFSLRAATAIPTGLIALALYERWGGIFPLSGLSSAALLPALYATLTQAALALLVFLPFVLYLGLRMADLTNSSASFWSVVRATFVGRVLPALAAPFAILSAGLHTQNGLGIFLFFVGGVLFGSFLAHLLSQAVERSQQRSRELEKLEQLAHAIMKAPPDGSTLPALLQAHVPAMFPSSLIEIRLLPDQTFVRFPDSDNWSSVPAYVWDWMRKTSQACYFTPETVQPWDNQPAGQSMVLAPIIDTETADAVGGIYITPRRSTMSAASLLPAVQSLAAQISSALHSAQVYARALTHQRVEQELALAGEIQARFLPDTLPEVPGWQLAVKLEPAQKTSGDFYDVIPLPNGRLGLLIADVADKGTAAALYMALSRTLIRTYAVEHHTRPDFALRVANNRILTDTQVDMFVTVFYGVLDPNNGRLMYCNAGHNPPLLLKAEDGGGVQKLLRTGLPLGIFPGRTWEHKTVQLDVGDVLVLYTDGVTEAQDLQESFFGEERLLAAALATRGHSARNIRASLLKEIHTFVGDAPQFDDIALMVLVREA